MKTRQLGESTIKVSEVGLGCWQLGSDWGDMPSDEKAFSILQAAVDHEINFFDTADVYGNGNSERLIGEFLRNHDSHVGVATKFGRGGDVYPDGYSEKALRTGVESSMKRLGVDTLDLLQLHCIPTEVMEKGEIFSWLRNLKNEGIIREFGASVESVDEGLLCIREEGLCSLQVIFNIFRQKLVTELLPQAHERGIGIIVRLPLASGLLAGKFTPDTKFQENDHRNFNRDGQLFNVGETFAGLPFEKGVELVDHIKNELLPDDFSMVQLALRWILDHEAVSTVIPGASSPGQVQSNSSVSDLPALSEELHTELTNLYQSQIHQHIRGVY